MTRHIKTFFYPQTKTYIYNLEKDAVVAQIEKVLNRKYQFFDENDIVGDFTEKDIFKISIKQAAYTTGRMGSTTVIGKISELGDGNSQISLKANPSFGYYFWFCLAIISGLGFMYKFIQSDLIEFLFWSLGALFIGPTLCVGISRVAIAAIYERYLIYIHKKLKT